MLEPEFNRSKSPICAALDSDRGTPWHVRFRILAHLNGGNCIVCSFCVFIGIWLIFVDIFTQSNTKLSLKGFLEVLSLHLKWVCYLGSQIGVL